MNFAMTDLSVIIINWNGKKYLAQCLDGLRKQIYRSFTTILVDNGSTDGSVEFVKHQYPDVFILKLRRNFGFSIANNIAFEYVNTKYAALLNNDAIPDPFWLKNLVGALESYPSAGLAASKMLFYDNPGTIDRAGDSYSKAGTGILRGRGRPKRCYDKYEWVFGACAGAALYRTEMLKDIGLFDENFFLLYEDVDLCFRAQLRGYKCLYVPNAVVYHKGSASIGQDTDMSVYYSHRNLEWVYFKNMPRKLLLRSFGLHLLYDVAALLFFLFKGKLKIFVKAKIDFIRNFKKIIRQRAIIQKNKKVDDNYIWSLLEQELFFSRLLRRFKKTNG